MDMKSLKLFIIILVSYCTVSLIVFISTAAYKSASKVFLFSEDPVISIKNNFQSVGKISKLQNFLLQEIESIGNVPPPKLQPNKKVEHLTPVSSLLVCLPPVRPVRQPKIYKIKFSNVYWQVLNLKNEANNNVVFLYGAYLDTREGQPIVRILLVSDRHFNSTDENLRPINRPFYCQFWYARTKDPVIIRTSRIDYAWNEIWGRWGKLHPFLASCELPHTNDTSFPESVSLVENMCDDPFNNLLIKYKVPQKRLDFGVCVKGLSFPNQDISLRLIQWIEMLRILGANRIHFYVFDVHVNVKKVLKYYEEQGIVSSKLYSMPGFQPNTPVIRHLYLNHYVGIAWTLEVIPYNDCLLTNMYKYKYIAAIDIDEVILPATVETWKELVTKSLDNLQERESTSLCYNMLTFVNKLIEKGRNKRTIIEVSNTDDVSDVNIPFMMRNVHEVGSTCDETETRNVKCFHSTEEVLLIHNHYPHVCLVNSSCWQTMDQSLGYVHHHKIACESEIVSGDLNSHTFHYDPIILKYKNELISRTRIALKEIRGF